MFASPDPAYQPLAMTADRVLRSLQSVLSEASREIVSGNDPQEILDAITLISYLVGQGIDVAAASRLVTDLKRAYISHVPRHHEPEGARRPELIRFIRGALQDEANAALFYTKLLDGTEDPIGKAYLRHIRDDEQKHFRMLSTLYEDLTGERYEVVPTETPFASLAEGYQKAMDDEYEAFEEYRSIYLHYDQEQIRRIFFELLTDELEHATRFNYLLQRLAYGSH